MTALGDHAAPPPAQLAPIPDFTREPTLTVSGTAEPLGFVEVALGGALAVAPVDAQGAFSLAVTLLPNQPNSLAVTTYDAAGNAAPTVNVVLIHDDVAPVVAIGSPTAGAVLEGTSVVVTGTVSDQNGATVEVNGVPATLQGGTFSVGVPLDAEVTGLTAVATDPAGNTAAASIAVTADPYLTTGTIGVDGGTVAAPPGSPLEGAAIIVPPGALAAPTLVGFARADQPPPLAEDLAPLGPALALLNEAALRAAAEGAAVRA
jgi:hypothetical protein